MKHLDALYFQIYQKIKQMFMKSYAYKGKLKDLFQAQFTGSLEITKMVINTRLLSLVFTKMC